LGDPGKCSLVSQLLCEDAKSTNTFIFFWSSESNVEDMSGDFMSVNTSRQGVLKNNLCTKPTAVEESEKEETTTVSL